MKKAPWFVDVHRQAEVLDRVVEMVIELPEPIKAIKAAQEQMWTKYDRYMLRRSAEC